MRRSKVLSVHTDDDEENINQAENVPCSIKAPAH